jgi:hypothetical protein
MFFLAIHRAQRHVEIDLTSFAGFQQFDYEKEL